MCICEIKRDNEMKRVLLVGDSPLQDSPYIHNYIEIFEQYGISYDLLYWNKHMAETNENPNNFIAYNEYTEITYPYWKKVNKIHGFTNFVKKHLSKNDYCYVVVFTIAHAIFLYPYLIKRYKKQYVFDIRDYSPLCKVPFIQKYLAKLIENSLFTVISSAGFLRWLPKGGSYPYVISHNTSSRMIKKYNDGHCLAPLQKIKGKISILTIGQLRDYEANVTMMEALKEENNVRLVFAGYGPASEKLERYAEKNRLENVIFTGQYNKAEEERIVMEHQMINAYLNNDINSDTLMSNRFYLSVLMKKPLIARKGSFQAEVIERYGLGVVLDDKDFFGEEIKKWWSSYDAKQYELGCCKFLECVSNEIDRFEYQLSHLA